MKEQEYINVRDLSHVMTAEAALREICAENQPNIPKKQLAEVIGIITDWREAMFNAIQTK